MFDTSEDTLTANQLDTADWHKPPPTLKPLSSARCPLHPSWNQRLLERKTDAHKTAHTLHYQLTLRLHHLHLGNLYLLLLFRHILTPTTSQDKLRLATARPMSIDRRNI